MDFKLRSVFSCLPKVERGVAKVLGGDPKGNNFLYTNGRSVIIRNVQNPAIADIYSEHAHPAIVAKYSPSGFYIASGDSSGKVRIWDTTQKEHILKYEYQVFSGFIKDIAWTEDSKRMAVVGLGRTSFGSVFLWDSGSSVGEINGHSKTINSVDFKQNRPYRMVTAGDDFSSVFFEGPPFKYNLSHSDHNRFVNCVRFSPTGSHYATAGGDGKILLYHGTSGNKVGSLADDEAHAGGINAICWNADGSHMLSVSSDKTAKVWDIATGKALTTFTMGQDLMDQQMGCLWQGQDLITVSLSGYINFLDQSNPNKPRLVVKGHSKSIQCLSVHQTKDVNVIFTASFEGCINQWDPETGACEPFDGKGHTNQVCSIAVEHSKRDLVSCSMDDTLRFTNMNSKRFSAGDVVKLDSQPRRSAVGSGGHVIVLCVDKIVLLKDRKCGVGIEQTGYVPQAVSVHPEGVTVAVGGSDENVHLYSIEGNSLRDSQQVLPVNGLVTDLQFSPNGNFLLVGDANRVITVFSVADSYKVENNYYGHHAKVIAVAWAPSSRYFASSGMDNIVTLWTLGNDDKRLKLQDCHRLHHTTALAWIDDNTLVTTSGDACVKQWTISHDGDIP
uniref:WD repeat-containing protein 1-like n=1 Tax=Myxine glutinosa TaxID=7769 RepID=UPI00358EE6EB